MPSRRVHCPQTLEQLLLADVVDRESWTGAAATREVLALVGDVATCSGRRSARIGPSGEWADAAYALARRAAHPGRRVEVDPDDDPLQYVGVARRPRYVLDDSDSATMRRTRRTGPTRS